MATKKITAKYMLVDGNALIHRGYHAMPGLTTKDGTPTGAVYGFTLILLKAIADLKPTHIACTFDLAAPTFRHLAYEGYKATRVKAAQELYDQIPQVKTVVRTLNIPIYEQEGFEADDLLGTLACEIKDRASKSKDRNLEIFIATGDLDTLQLVDDTVKIYTLRQGLTDTAVYDAKAVRDRYGLNPDQMLDYRALKGDPSDNIPGVRGIGEKTAIELIRQFGSLNNLYTTIKKEIKQAEVKISNDKFQIPNKFQISKIKPRILKMLVEQETGARQSYELSTIKCDVPVKVDLPPYEFTKAHFEAAFKLFQELEFKSLVARLPKTYGSHAASEQVVATAAGEEDKAYRKRIGKQNYQLVDSAEMLEDAVRELESKEELALDTESDSLAAMEARLVGVGLCCTDGTAYYVPAKLALQSDNFKKLLENPKIKKIGHNLKYDLQVLSNVKCKVSSVYFDTMIASYLLNPGTRQHNLEALAFSELGYHMQPIEELIGKGKKQITMDQVAADKVAFYCGEDVDMTLRLKNLFEPELKKAKLEKIFHDMEMPLVEVLAGMERNGIILDVKFLNKLTGQAEVEIKELEREIHTLTGREFNINSPKQLKEILFEVLKLEPVENRKTKTGLSTAAGELEKMLGQHAVIPKLLEYRELTKLYSTYLVALPALVNKATGRIHTSYSQTIAATGRLSSSDPNLQNIPVRGTGMGNKIRQAFVAEKGYKFLSLDYSQIELRIVAHLAQDEKMLAVFRAGQDIHTKTAMEIFGVKNDQVTPDMRRDAKTINFGILYGLSSFGLSSRIGEVSRTDAKKFIDAYFEAYPAVKAYIDGIKREVAEHGMLTNQIGRIRRFPDIAARNWAVRAAAERAAINFPIQSLAADIIKVAMIHIDSKIRNSAQSSDVPPHRMMEANLGTVIRRAAPSNDGGEIRILLQVHDELLFEVAEDKVSHYAEMLCPLMENAIRLSVPIKVEAKVGGNWGELKPLLEI